MRQDNPNNEAKKAKKAKKVEIKFSSGKKDFDRDVSEITTIESALDLYLDDIGRIAYAYPITIEAMNAGRSKSLNGLVQIIKKYAKVKRKDESSGDGAKNDEKDDAAEADDEENKLISVDFHLDVPDNEEAIVFRETKMISRSMGARDLVARSFISSLVSQYDAYIGNLLRAIFEIRPEILNASEKSLTFTQLQKFSSIEEARNNIADKEIETVLRDSHSDHFDWFRKQLKINLKPREDLWGRFIELTERRNIFAHSNGVVSQQYISVCQKHEVELPEDCRLGDKLTVTDSYFDQAYECLFEIGLQLAHVLWRSLNKADREDADRHILEKCIDLMHEGKFALSSRISEFFLRGMKSEFSSERIRREAWINLAYCYKKMNDTARANSALESEDWSAVSTDLLIFIHILKSEFKEAADLMKVLQTAKSSQKNEYYTNPLFSEFVKTSEFQEMYHEIYGEAYVSTEKVTSVSEDTEKTEDRSLKNSKENASDGSPHEIISNARATRKRQSQKARVNGKEDQNPTE